jgi:type I restriction enzyme S subunit
MTMSKTLADCVTFINGDRGKNYPKQVDFANGEVPFISATDLSNHSLSNQSDYQKKISKSAYEKLRSGKVIKKDVLLCLRGSLGKLGVVSDDMVAAIASSLVILRPNAQINSEFLFQWLRSPEFQQTLASFDNGSVQGNLSVKSISTIEVPNFSPNHQRAIAHILGTLDDKIKLNQKMNQTLEEIAKAIFKSWFVDFDPVRAKADGRPTGLPPEISDLFPDELVDSEIGEIPKGWSQESIYQFCSVEYGAPFKSKLFNEDGQGVPLVRIRDLPKGKSGVFTEEIHPKGTLIKAGDLVVGMDGEFRCYLWRGTDSWMNQRVCKFVPKENLPSTFIWFALERPLHFIESTEVATTVIHLGKGDIDDFQFMRSSQELLDQFSKFTSPLLERMVIASKEIEILAKLRDTLLPKLISGEIRIPDAEKFLEEAGI